MLPGVWPGRSTMVSRRSPRSISSPPRTRWVGAARSGRNVYGSNPGYGTASTSTAGGTNPLCASWASKGSDHIAGARGAPSRTRAARSCSAGCSSRRSNSWNPPMWSMCACVHRHTISRARPPRARRARYGVSAPTPFPVSTSRSRSRPRRYHRPARSRSSMCGSVITAVRAVTQVRLNQSAATGKAGRSSGWASWWLVSMRSSSPARPGGGNRPPAEPVRPPGRGDGAQARMAHAPVD